MITTDELREWSGVTASDPGTVAALDEAVASANALIVRRCRDDLPVPWPAEVHTAALIEGARQLKRRGSPEGVAGLGDFGMVRVSAWDPTVEANLSPWLKVTFA